MGTAKVLLTGVPLALIKSMLGRQWAEGSDSGIPRTGFKSQLSQGRPFHSSKLSGLIHQLFTASGVKGVWGWVPQARA